ncbi:MAG: hypothetical protein P1U88_02850 [Thalassobaculaceae bacterium]|nr:hypothetical protein [Thalassobaculaceae bacterium]
MRRTRLVKNARLDTVVELFNDSRAGSGQIDINALSDYFDTSAATFDDDRTIVEALAQAPSFDVYSLRLTLRSHNIKVDDAQHLRLSPQTQEKLTEYMRVFTRPLVQKVFGDDTKDVSSASEIFEMFRGVDRDEAFKRIKAISDALGIEVEKIPGFLEDYGDIFLSLSYFKRYMEDIRPTFERFKAWSDDGIRKSHLRHNKDAMRNCDIVDTQVDEAIAFAMLRFKAFDEASREFWKDLSKDRYAHLRRLVTSNHHTIAGILCGLSVKMIRWEEDFPGESGSPNKRADWLLAEMVPGLDKIRHIQKTAPSLDAI